MKLSVIIPWRDRPELAEALQANARFLRRDDIEVLIVNGGGDFTAMQCLLKEHGWPGIRRIDLAGGRPFNKGECLNLGGSLSTGDSLFFLDADVILVEGFVDRVLEELAHGDRFTSVAVVRESEPELVPARWDPSSAIQKTALKRELTARNGNMATIEFWANTDGTRTGAGLIAVQRGHFVEVKGSNSALEGWGFEDYDLQIRLQLALGLKRRTFGEVVHLSHESRMQQETNQRNQAECFANYKQGRFNGTYEDDVARLAGGAIEAAP